MDSFLGILFMIVFGLAGLGFGFGGVGYLLPESASWISVLGFGLGGSVVSGFVAAVVGLFFGVWLGDKLD